jgi:5'-3' exonuclease
MYQAMVGDSCDSIKGVGGIGPKSAPLIIKDKFPEDYPTFKEEITGNQTICKKLEKLKLKFSGLQEPYETNLQLVTLCTEVPMEMEPDSLVPLENDAFHSEDWKEMCSLMFAKQQN